jgi:hypothetical protein
MFIAQDGGIDIKCVAERIDTRIKYHVKATLTKSSDDGWDPLGCHCINIE